MGRYRPMERGKAVKIKENGKEELIHGRDLLEVIRKIEDRAALMENEAERHYAHQIVQGLRGAL